MRLENWKRTHEDRYILSWVASLTSVNGGTFTPVVSACTATERSQPKVYFMQYIELESCLLWHQWRIYIYFVLEINTFLKTPEPSSLYFLLCFSQYIRCWYDIAGRVNLNKFHLYNSVLLYWFYYCTFPYIHFPFSVCIAVNIACYLCLLIL